MPEFDFSIQTPRSLENCNHFVARPAQIPIFERDKYVEYCLSRTPFELKKSLTGKCCAGQIN